MNDAKGDLDDCRQGGDDCDQEDADYPRGGGRVPQAASLT
jgi:hypothetical protein